MEKEQRSIIEKIKISAKALSQSTKQVFGELGKATNQVMDFDETIERMPQ